MCWKQFKNIGQSLKNLGPSQKTLRNTWCPKLVTDLLCPDGLAFIYPASPTCLVVFVQKSCFHLIKVFCEEIVKQCTMSTPDSLLSFCTA